MATLVSTRTAAGAAAISELMRFSVSGLWPPLSEQRGQAAVQGRRGDADYARQPRAGVRGCLTAAGTPELRAAHAGAGLRRCGLRGIITYRRHVSL
jgi:hypothetical protein